MTQQVIISENVPLCYLPNVQGAMERVSAHDDSLYPGEWVTVIYPEFSPQFEVGIKAMLSQMTETDMLAQINSDGDDIEVLENNPGKFLKKLTTPPFSMITWQAHKNTESPIFISPRMDASILGFADQTTLIESANQYHVRSIDQLNHRLGVLASPYALEALTLTS